MHLPTGLKLASNLLRGKMTGRPRLTQCNLHLSFRCNLRCSYCNYPRLGISELSTEDWLRIVDQMAELGCCRVDLTGGEPLLHPDLPEVIDRVRDKGMACVVASNGLLVPERIRDLRRINTLILSLDSFRPVNDRLRGSGAGASTLAALEAARSVGIAVKINAVLTKEMIPGLDELLSFARTKRIPLTVNMLRSGNPVLWNRAAELRPGPLEARQALLRLAGESWRNSWLLFSPLTYRQAAAWPDYAIDYVDELNSDLRSPQRQGPRCQAGRYYLSIMPDGRTAPCALRFQAGPFGDSAKKGLEVAWRNLWNHTCLDCYSPCKLEQNYLYSAEKSVLVNFAVKHLFRVT